MRKADASRAFREPFFQREALLNGVLIKSLRGALVARVRTSLPGQFVLGLASALEERE